VSSVTPISVTISAPPSVLQEFLTVNSLKAHHLPIELPYHSSQLFNSSDIDEAVGHFHEFMLKSYKPRFRILSAASGHPIAADSYRTLLQAIVSDTLQNPLRWDRVLPTIAESVSNFKQCTIYPLSSTSSQLLSSTLTRNTNVEVSISDLVDSGSSPSSSGHTGKFDHSKIAIIGYSGRFPDAASNEEFWDLLHAGLDVHRTIPEDRFDWKAHFDATGKKRNTSRIQYGCFIKEPGLFDTRFFNMSPRECENTDPAQRLAITATYEAIEMAGLVPNRTPSTQQDRIGVFFGITSDDWREVNSGQNVDTYFIPGGNRAFVPGRIR
jgi:naphtho-gamma-pyrone polyketide synthase